MMRIDRVLSALALVESLEPKKTLVMGSNRRLQDMVGTLPLGAADNQYVKKAGDTMTGDLTLDTGCHTDTVDEKTAATGVTVDSVLLKDGYVKLKSGTLAMGILKWGPTAATGLYVRNAADTAYSHILCQNLLVQGNIPLLTDAAIQTKGVAVGEKFYIKAYDGLTVIPEIVATVFADSVGVSDENFQIDRAGHINIIDDRFIRIGKDSDGSLPTPDASYRGKMIRVEGGESAADKLYCCMKKADNSYDWVQVASG